MSNFTFTETFIKDLYVVDVKTYGDKRGYFMETYKQTDFEEAGLKYCFVQDNQSSSCKGVMRGLHFQKQFPQAKLIRVVSGEIFDVAVDLRRESVSFGKWFGLTLSEENHRQLMIPRGFAHGFLVTSSFAVISYKCDQVYHPEDEAGIIWNDPDLAVSWPDTGVLIMSEKDKKHPLFSEIRSVL